MVSEYQVYADLYYVWLRVLYGAMCIGDVPLIREARGKVDYYHMYL